MLDRRQVANEKDIRVPRKVLWVLRAADEEALKRATPCRLDHQRRERVLTIGGIGAEIGKVAAITVRAGHRVVDLGIDVPRERYDPASAQTAAQLVERGTARARELHARCPTMS